ncbi:hypothetical protein ACSNOB_22995 [Micromonospora sp. URMC 106]
MSQRTRTDAMWLLPHGGASLPTGERSPRRCRREQGRQPGWRRD